MNVIFDIGSVLLTWDPLATLRDMFGSERRANEVFERVFAHPDWLEFDRGSLDDAQAIELFAAHADISTLQMGELLERARHSLVPLEGGIALLTEARARGLVTYCLSNMPTRTYEFLRERYAFFEDFRGIVISGTVKMIKPDPRLYLYALQEFAIPAHQTVFIDDREDNVQAACQLGIRGLQFDPSAAGLARLSQELASLQPASRG